MGTLKLNSQMNNNSTIVSNQFFDKYMPDANGEFVKVYLYLLRCMSTKNDIDLSVSMLADKFNHTENDIMRALKYWTKAGLISLSFNGPDGPNGGKSEQDLTAITLLDPVEDTAGSTNNSSNTNASTTQTFNANITSPTLIEPVVARPPKPVYSSSQLRKFAEKEDLCQLLYIAQKYLGKTLSSTETNSIIYFYETLAFPCDLIEYLIEYCVSGEHTSMRYIEKVALSWANAGITTVAAAKEETASHNKNVYSVMKAFGISNRNLGQKEFEYIAKWTDTYCFNNDIILEACNRTIQKTHQPSFEYADSILSNWKNSNIQKLSDLKELDDKFAQSKATKPVSKNNNNNGNSNNKFNNFNQRDYDYDELEKQLLSHNG